MFKQKIFCEIYHNMKVNLRAAITKNLFSILISVTIANCCYGGTYGGGSGTANDPFQIASAEHMNEIGVNPEDWDKCFKLTSNINMESIPATSYNIIGYYNDSENNKGFSGVFDGNDHVIFNFSCTSSRGSHVGFFGYVEGYDAEIKDLILVGPNVSASNSASENVGTLAGVLRYGRIINCRVDGGSVNGYDYVGGLVGENSSGEITASCVINGQANGHNQIGGLVGDSSFATISNCYANRNVTGNTHVGGLIGVTDGGTIEKSYASGSVSGDPVASGGLIGMNGGTATVVNNCFWDTQTSGQISSAGGTGKISAEMQTESMFTSVGWDFVNETVNGTSDIWMMSPEHGYPVLTYLYNIDYNPVVPELNVLQVSKTTVSENEPFTVTVSGRNIGVTEPSIGGIAIQVKQADYENRKMDVSDYQADGALNTQYIWWKGDEFPAGQTAYNLHIEPTWDDWFEERTLYVTFVGRQAGTYDIHAKMYLEAYNGKIYRDPEGEDTDDHHGEATIKIGTVTVLKSLPGSLYEIKADKLHRQDITGNGVKIGMIDEGYPDDSLACFEHVTIKENFGLSPHAIHADLIAPIIVGCDATSHFIPEYLDRVFCGISTKASMRAEYLSSESSGDFISALDNLKTFNADVVNASISLNPNGEDENPDNVIAMKYMDKLIDKENVTIVVSNGNVSKGHITSAIPARGFNCISVGTLSDDTKSGEGEWNIISSNNVSGPIANGTYHYGAYKPDIVAPGRCYSSNGLSSYYHIYSTIDASAFSSISAPHVTGSIALLTEIARQNNLDDFLDTNNKLDPRVVKSVLLTGANKQVKGSGDRNWGTPDGSIQPLDRELGAGGLDVYESARVLVGAESEFFKGYTSVHTLPKQTEESFDLDEISAEGMHLAATIVWNKHENADLANLNLELLDKDDNSNVIKSSASLIDNVEHIYYEFIPPGNYSLKVMHEDDDGPSTEDYALSYRVFHSGFSVIRKPGDDFDYLYINELPADKLEAMNETQSLVGTSLEVTSYTPSSQGNFATIRIFYDIDKFPEIDEKTIKIKFWNPLLVQWDTAGDFSNVNKNSLAKFTYGPPTDNLGDWGIDMEGGYAWANIDALGTYALIGATEPICPEKPDIDNNGSVDLGDFVIFAEGWLEVDCDCYADCCHGADLNSDNLVDVLDINIFLENWLSCDFSYGLIGYWSFDDGTAKDNSDNGNDGTNYGATSITGISGQGMNFNGTNSYITTHNFNYPSVTISGWFKANDVISDQYILSQDTEGIGLGDFVIEVGQAVDSKLTVMYDKRGAPEDNNYYYVTYNEDIEVGEWYFIAVTMDNDSVKLYVNGALEGTGLGFTYFGDSGGKFDIGGYNFNTTAVPFNGVVDEIRIYGRVLSAEEIAYLYGQNNPNVIYNPDNGHYYEAVEESLTWAEAKAASEARIYKGRYGHLATITSESENEFLKTNIIGSNPTYCLGGFQPTGSVEPSGDWQWVTGEEWDWTNWWTGEPNNNGNEDWLFIHGSLVSAFGRWNDDKVDTQAHFIVEYE